MDNISTLKRICNSLTSKTGYTPVVATEIEFYLEDAAGINIEEIFKQCYRKFGSAGVITYSFEKEAADGQFEISTLPLPDPVVTANNTVIIKEIIASTFAEAGAKASFLPKPYDNKPGSGLHIHVNLLDSSGHNIFQKEYVQSNEESEILKQAVAGLCETMNESMIFFAPNEDSYKRYTAKHEEGEEYNNAPVNVSWGGNNRTTAIRIPTSTLHPDKRHLEHRVAGADADPYAVIAAILAGIDYGISNKLELKNDKIWGNAFDKQYNLAPLPRTLDEAKASFENGKIIKKYFL